MISKKVILFFVLFCFVLNIVNCESDDITYRWYSYGTNVVLGETNEFSYPFPLPGVQNIVLEINSPSILNGISNDNTIQFYVVYPGQSYCYNDKESGGPFWIVDDEDNPIVSSKEDCYRTDTYGSRTTCCSPGYKCEIDKGVCSLEKSDIIMCSDYTIKEDCENDTSHVAEVTNEKIVNIENFCDGVITRSGNEFEYASDCSCVWNSTTNTCGASYRVVGTKEDGTLKEDSYYKCTTSTTISEGNCTAGDEYRLDKIKAEYCAYDKEGNLEPNSCKEDDARPVFCRDATRKIDCGNVVSLPFFDGFGFVIAVVLIVVYTVYVFKFKKKSVKKK